jgi:hypothetical protein
MILCFPVTIGWGWGGTRLDDGGVIQINVHRA